MENVEAPTAVGEHSGLVSWELLELADWNMPSSRQIPDVHVWIIPFAKAFILRIDAWGCGRQHDCWNNSEHISKHKTSTVETQ